MYITLSILVLSAVFFMSGKVRSDLVAVCSLLLLILFGILTPEEALSGFSNSIVIMMIGLFVVGGAIFQTGLAKMMSSRILRLAGNNEVALLVLVMLVTALIGSFVSNTGTVALMLPIIVSMAMNNHINTSRLLMPLAFASSMGGMMTLIGTPPNLIIDNLLVENGYQKLNFFTFTPVGLVSLLVGFVFLIPASKWLLSKKNNASTEKRNKKSLTDLVGEYQLNKNIRRVRITESSKLIGLTLQEANITKKYHISVLEVRRKPRKSTPFQSINTEVAHAKTIFQQDDVLFLQGTITNIEKFASENNLSLYELPSEEAEVLDFNEIGIAEVLIMPTSKLVNQQVKTTGFRTNFGLNIIGIQRHKTYLLENLKEERIHPGDVLLVQGTWDNIGKLPEDRNEWLLLGQPLSEAEKVTLNHKAPIAAIIMIAMVCFMMFDFIPIQPVTAVMLAAVMMILSGALRNVEAAYKTINWESIVLIAAMLPMALALEKTGVSKLVSENLVSQLGEYSPYVLLAGIYFTTSLMTMFISNTATAVLLAPIALQSAQAMEIAPQSFLFAVAVASSMCFASPFSTPPNALVMSAGRYSFSDYVKVGLPLQIIMGIVMIFILPLLFPF